MKTVIPSIAITLTWAIWMVLRFRYNIIARSPYQLKISLSSVMILWKPPPFPNLGDSTTGREFISVLYCRVDPIFRPQTFVGRSTSYEQFCRISAFFSKQFGLVTTLLSPEKRRTFGRFIHGLEERMALYRALLLSNVVVNVISLYRTGMFG